jgi:hypothetical protein
MTGYGLDGLGTIPGAGKRLLFTSQCLNRLWDAPSLLSNGYRGTLTPGVKLPGREADQLSPSSTEVKNGGAIPLLPDTSSWSGA